MQNQQTGEIFKLEGTEAKDFALDGGEIKIVDGEELVVKAVPQENFNRIKRMAIRQRELALKTAKNRARKKIAIASKKDQRK